MIAIHTTASGHRDRSTTTQRPSVAIVAANAIARKTELDRVKGAAERDRVVAEGVHQGMEHEEECGAVLPRVVGLDARAGGQMNAQRRQFLFDLTQLRLRQRKLHARHGKTEDGVRQDGDADEPHQLWRGLAELHVDCPTSEPSDDRRAASNNPNRHTPVL